MDCHASPLAADVCGFDLRTGQAIDRGDWYLFAEGDLLVIGHVAEIAELRIGVVMLVRLWLDECFRAPNEGVDGCMSVPVMRKARSMLVRLETVAVTPLLLCDQSNIIRKFRRVL